jgi:hypothetical protein
MTQSKNGQKWIRRRHKKEDIVNLLGNYITRESYKQIISERINKQIIDIFEKAKMNDGCGTCNKEKIIQFLKGIKSLLLNKKEVSCSLGTTLEHHPECSQLKISIFIEGKYENT